MDNLDKRCDRFWRRPRRKTRGCVIHNKRLATPVCVKSDLSPQGCSVFGRLRRCEACEWDDHSPHLTPCMHPEYAATFDQIIH